MTARSGKAVVAASASAFNWGNGVMASSAVETSLR